MKKRPYELPESTKLEKKEKLIVLDAWQIPENGPKTTEFELWICPTGIFAILNIPINEMDD